MIPESLGMVSSYLNGMSQVFTGLAHHMKAGSPVFLDIGDSAYGGVHVPTDKTTGRGSLRLWIPIARERSSPNENVPNRASPFLKRSSPSS